MTISVTRGDVSPHDVFGTWNCEAISRLIIILRSIQIQMCDRITL